MRNVIFAKPPVSVWLRRVEEEHTEGAGQRRQARMPMAERLMNLLRGAGSILDLWPVPPKVEDLSPHDADEMFRRSWRETAAVLQRAMNEVDLNPETEEEPKRETTPLGGSG